MKYVVLILVLLVIIAIARAVRRRGSTPPPAAPRPQRSGPQEMIACAHCGVHLPRSESVNGRGGLFCGEPHRLQFERAHPEP